MLSCITVSPRGNKPMCVFYHTCVVKTQHLPVCYFHICVVISTHMCERAHMCGKNHTSCPRVVCGVYHTCVGKTFVLSFLRLFPSHFLTPKNVCMRICNNCICLTFALLCIFKCVLEAHTKLHLFDFSPLYVFKCLLKWPVTLIAFV